MMAEHEPHEETRLLHDTSSAHQNGDIYDSPSPLRVTGISPYGAVSSDLATDDSQFERSLRGSHIWDKMLMDDLLISGDNPPGEQGRLQRAFSRCAPSRKTKETLNSVKVAVMFLSMLVCAIFFTLKEEVVEQPEVFPVSNSLFHLVDIPKLGENVFIKAKFKGPVWDYVNASSTENITLSLLLVKEDNTTMVIKQTSYEILRDYDLADTSHWIELEEIFDVKKTERGASFQLRFESNTDDVITLESTYTLLPASAAQDVIWAAIILVGVYFLIGFELVHRTTAAMLGSFATLAVLTSFNERPSLDTIMEWLDYDTLALLWGMMTIVAIFSETGFFDYCALLAYKWAKGKVWTLVTILCFFSGIVSAFLDNVTTILLLTPVTISLCEVLDIDPRYVLIAEVVFSNIGGTATAIGDPPNVIIVSNSDIQAAHYQYPKIMGIGFANFTMHMSVGIIFVMIVGYGMLRLLYRGVNLHSLEPPKVRDLKREIEIWRKSAIRIMVASKEESTVKALLMQKVSQLETELRNAIYEHRQTTKANTSWKDKLTELEQKYRITDKVLFIKCSCVLIVTILLFFIHSVVTGIYLDIGWIAVIGAVSLILLADIHDIENIMHRVEWATLLFFAALFVLMEGLTELGLIKFIGDFVADIIDSVPPEHRLLVALILILWVSALASSFIDNIPFTTAMIPIILELAEREELGLPLEPLVWALAFGACLGGNGTLIGASANVVCAGIADQHGYSFSFYNFFRVGFPMMLCTTFVAMIYLIICHVALEWH